MVSCGLLCSYQIYYDIDSVLDASDNIQTLLNHISPHLTSSNRCLQVTAYHLLIRLVGAPTFYNYILIMCVWMCVDVCGCGCIYLCIYPMICRIIPDLSLNEATIKEQQDKEEEEETIRYEVIGHGQGHRSVCLAIYDDYYS